jgi:hypothetical protein
MLTWNRKNYIVMVVSVFPNLLALLLLFCWLRNRLAILEGGGDPPLFSEKLNKSKIAINRLKLGQIMTFLGTFFPPPPKRGG